MGKGKGNFVQTAFQYHSIVILVCCMLIIAGIFSLKNINKNEFPEFALRQGVVVAVYPGATPEQVESELTEPLEDYIFRYREVNKEKTRSVSQSGMSIVIVSLNDNLDDQEAFWTRFKDGLAVFKTELPPGVVATQVLDDFGDCSAMLITFEGDNKTYDQLNHYVEELKTRLRPIEAVGRMTVTGMQEQQISIRLDAKSLSHYGLNDKVLATSMFAQTFNTTPGALKSKNLFQPVYVDRTLASEFDIANMVILNEPGGNGAIRLKDVGEIRREYPEPTEVITNNGHKCLLLSIEMKKDKDIVAMGHKIKQEIEEFKKEMPSDITMFNITDQTQVVEDSVYTFLKELLIAIIAVILVVVILLPIRTALVAASTIPVTVFISLSLFYVFGFELNTITLCLLIVTLGMIVDDAIVIIDAYLDRITNTPDLDDEKRKEASIWAARHYFKSVLSATLAITATFFPMLYTVRGILKDFLHDFPLGITIILFVSLLIAQILVPYLQYIFIKEPPKKQSSFLTWAQAKYDVLITWCFRNSKWTISLGLASVAIGIFMAAKMPQRLIPTAERNQFAVEIYLPGGTSLEKTSMIADSLEHMISRDKRVISVASFKGCSSPRFQTSYAPHLPGSNFAQFIVNTTGNKATVSLLDELEPKYCDYFPEAFVRFKQLNYSDKDYPVEIIIEGNNLKKLRMAVDSVKTVMRTIPELEQPRSDLGNQAPSTHIVLDGNQAARYGVTSSLMELSMLMRYSNGFKVGSVWEDGHETPVVIMSNHGGHTSVTELEQEPVPTVAGFSSVPISQIASIEPKWEESSIPHLNGVRTATVMSEFRRDMKGNGITAVRKIKKELKKKGEQFLPAGVELKFGGDYSDFNTYMPGIIWALFGAIIVNFLIMLIHFHKVSTATLLLCCFALTLFGTAAGVLLFGVDFGSTPVLGMVTLMGVLVRNCTIMIDYTEQLIEEGVPLYDACLASAQRRMRPILLTSTAAAVGVIPMIISQNSLWMPMGAVIFTGTLCTMFFIVTFIPVAFYLVNKKRQ